MTSESWRTKAKPVETQSWRMKAKPVEATSDAPAAPPWSNVVANAGPEAVAGLADTVINFGPNAVRLGQMAYGAGATALGHPDMAPSITPPRQYAREGLSRLGAINDIPNTQMTQGQRVVNAMIQAGTLGALAPAQSLSGTALNASKIGFVGGIGQTATELTGDPKAGLAVNLIAPSAATRITSLARRRVALAANRAIDNATAEQTLRDAHALGFKTTPGSLNPTNTNVIAERIAGKNVVEGDISTHNQRMVDNVVRGVLQVPKTTPLTPEVMKNIRNDEFTRGYAPVERIGQIQTDGAFRQAIQDIKSKFTGASNSFPGAEPDVIGKIVKTYGVDTFDSADAIKASAILREEAATNFLKGETRVAKAQAAASKALEDQIERHLQNSGPQNKAILDQFKESRRRMAISHTVEDAIRVGSGHVEGKVLARNLQGGKPLAPELGIVAKFANTFPFVNRSQAAMGTPGTNSVQLSASARMLPSAIGGALGAHMGGWEGAGLGSIVGSQLPAITSKVATRYLMSPMGQRNAFADYRTPIANLLAKDSLTPQEKVLLHTLIVEQQTAPQTERSRNAYANMNP